MPRSPSVPSYRLHKSTGQAVVTVRAADGSRRDIYLGVYDSPASRTEYARVIAEQASAKGAPVVGTSSRLTVDQVILAFLAHAKVHYRQPGGESSESTITEFKNSVKFAHVLYGTTEATKFGPKALKTVRTKLIEAGNARTTINARMARVKLMFKWAASEELIPVEVYTALATVAGLEADRTEARESEPVLPVAPPIVDATIAHLKTLPAGLVRFQQCTGCRPGEARLLRMCEVDTSGAIWLYKPKRHKTARKGKARVIAIGPKGQALLREYLSDDPSAYVFGGAEPVPRRSYELAIHRACDKAKVQRWAPNRLRHTFATEVRKTHGLEAAQVTLGHSRADVTQVYAEKNLALAVSVASEVG